MARDHRKLRAFALADQLVLSVYTATRAFPTDEKFGLTQQLRRAVVSVAANIVEACARQTQREYLYQLNVAFGSPRESGYFIDLAARLQYLPSEQARLLLNEYDECCRVLAGLMQSLRQKSESMP